MPPSTALIFELFLGHFRFARSLAYRSSRCAPRRVRFAHNNAKRTGYPSKGGCCANVSNVGTQKKKKVKVKKKPLQKAERRQRDQKISARFARSADSLRNGNVADRFQPKRRSLSRRIFPLLSLRHPSRSLLRFSLFTSRRFVLTF